MSSSQPAGFLVRIMAMIYDALVVLGIWVFTIVILVTVSGDAVVGAWVQSLLFVELFAFFAYFWIRRGQTIGMLAWRLRIVSAEPMTLRKVLMRFVGALLGSVCLFVGYLWILIDTERRSWSDLLSDSQVVRDPKPPKKPKDQPS
ncbi:MAG: RDD family protein [Gammaproteobacteria bacterium]|nr:RDD family protein [Gammaproteobacteria bacterium]